MASALSHVGAAGDTQRLHVFVRRQKLPDYTERCESRKKGQRLRIELRLDGQLWARYEGQYVELAECGVKPPDQPAPPRDPGSVLPVGDSQEDATHCRIILQRQ